MFIGNFFILPGQQASCQAGQAGRLAGERAQAGKIFYFLLLLLLFFSCSCNKSGTGPKPPETKPDTTSHNFVWQVESIGDLTSSLSDVFAIANDDIWAVGRIQIEDSAGNDIIYNAVHWNGEEWELKRFTNTNGSPIVPIRSIFYFSDNDIWLTAGSIYHWNGNIAVLSYQRNINTSELVQRLWVSTPFDIYGIGTEGIIVHYNGSTWQKQESNTTVRLLDVWGNSNGIAVWTCGYASNNSESILLRYDGSEWQTVWRWHFQSGASDTNYVGLLSSLWAFDPDSLIIVSGDGVFRQDMIGSAPPRTEKLTLGAFPSSVRGSAPNNIFIVGFEGMVWHYNGATWKTYPELRNPNWVFRSAAVLENKIVAVGADYSQGIQRDLILTGIRP